VDILRIERKKIPAVMRLLKECIADMQAHGIDQWDESYPTEEMVSDDIQCQSLYGIKDEEGFIAIVTIDERGVPEYNEVKWLTQDGSSLFVHRLAVHPKWHRKKIATTLMDFAEQLANDKHYASIRLDVYSGNFRGVGLYESCGYKRTGQVYFRGMEKPFICYEKILSLE